LFDIDGTLIWSARAGKDAVLDSLADVFGATADPDEVEFAGRTDRAIIADLFRLYGIAWTPSNWQQFQQSYLRHLPRYLQQRSGQVLGGVHELLGQLRQSVDMHVGLLTGNVQAGAREKLQHFQLWDYFAFGGYGDDHFSRDDVAREALQNAHRYLRIEGDQSDVWVIGDTPNDVRCGRAIGARVLAVATGNYASSELAASRPDVLLEDLSATSRVTELLAG
jgi:phosphoglycolate phosphatase-like HAD superfamily hydrolase